MNRILLNTITILVFAIALLILILDFITTGSWRSLFAVNGLIIGFRIMIYNSDVWKYGHKTDTK